jgi:hypothetical protein
LQIARLRGHLLAGGRAGAVAAQGIDPAIQRWHEVELSRTRINDILGYRSLVLGGSHVGAAK